MFLSFLFFFSFIFTAEIEVSIENFVDDGEGSVTFDLYMKNDTPVAGIEIRLKSGNGIYDEGDTCDPASEYNQGEKPCY